MTANETEGHRYSLGDMEPLPSIEEEEKAAYPGMSEESIAREQRDAEEETPPAPLAPNMAAGETVGGGPMVPLVSEEVEQVE